MHEPVTENAQYLTLTEAARIAPGRPAPNCVWRWCRRGVLSRAGERVRLQHVRIGGTIYTTARWLEEFGGKLAEADAKYFTLCDAAAEAARAAAPISSAPRRRASAAQVDEQRRVELAAIRRRLDAEGL
jgi:hypothetical protein